MYIYRPVFNLFVFQIYFWCSPGPLVQFFLYMCVQSICVFFKYIFGACRGPFFLVFLYLVVRSIFFFEYIFGACRGPLFKCSYICVFYLSFFSNIYFWCLPGPLVVLVFLYLVFRSIFFFKYVFGACRGPLFKFSYTCVFNLSFLSHILLVLAGAPCSSFPVYVFSIYLFFKYI